MRAPTFYKFCYYILRYICVYLNIYIYTYGVRWPNVRRTIPHQPPTGVRHPPPPHVCVAARYCAISARRAPPVAATDRRTETWTRRGHPPPCVCTTTTPIAGCSLHYRHGHGQWRKCPVVSWGAAHFPPSIIRVG